MKNIHPLSLGVRAGSKLYCGPCLTERRPADSNVKNVHPLSLGVRAGSKPCCGSYHTEFHPAGSHVKNVSPLSRWRERDGVRVDAVNASNKFLLSLGPLNHLEAVSRRIFTKPNHHSGVTEGHRFTLHCTAGRGDSGGCGLDVGDVKNQMRNRVIV